MDAFTMVILACVAGEPTCSHSFQSEIAYDSAQACENGIDASLAAMTKEFGKRPELKGKEVSYDVSCMDRKQLQTIFGVAQSDT